MIAEAWAHLTTPCAQAPRALGYLREAIAVEARHRRHAAAWAPHLAATRAYIEQAAEAAPRGAALIVGSGSLFDVPVDALAEKFDRVVLADIVHLRSARHKTRHHDNVEHRVVDVTGCIESLYKHLRLSDESVPSVAGEFALVVSVNMLSQLPILPMRWAEALGAPESLQTDLGRSVIDFHLAWAGTVGAHVITDVERIYTRGHDVEREDALLGAELPPGREWIWQAAPGGELGGGVSMDLRVRAFRARPATESER